jgi:large subunit ribosomal protein L15
MQLHELKPKTPQKDRRYVGRGGKRGKTAGRGTKGQKARAGAKIRPEIRDIIKRLPKLRGRGKNSNKSFRAKPNVVNLGDIDTTFKAGDVVSPTTLLTVGLVRRHAGETPKVKILGTGEITKKLTFESCVVSESAKEKIAKAGGTIK